MNRPLTKPLNGNRIRPEESELEAMRRLAPGLLKSLENCGEHVADWHRLRKSATDEASRLLDTAKSQSRGLTPTESDCYEGIVTVINQCDARVQANNATRAAGFDDDRVSNPDSTKAFIPRNAKVGSASLGDPDLDRASVGTLMKAMVAGTNSPTIRNVLAEGTDSAGGYTVPTALVRNFIDRMRAESVCVTAGAQTVLLETSKTNVARLETDPVPAWRSENAAVAESDPTFGTVLMTARSLAVMCKVSRELLEDSVNIEAALTNALAQALALELDRVALLGSGTAPEPTGIVNTANILSQSMGTNGAALTSYGTLNTALASLAAYNAVPSAAIMAPRSYFSMAALVDTTNQPLLKPWSLMDLPLLKTSQIPITQTQGTSTDASTIIVGDFTKLIIGVRQGIRIELLKERYAENMQYAFVAHMRADIAVQQPKAFLKVIGVR
jgi:HK97 family phage major capsid protein